MAKPNLIFFYISASDYVGGIIKDFTLEKEDLSKANLIDLQTSFFLLLITEEINRVLGLQSMKYQFFRDLNLLTFRRHFSNWPSK